MYVCMYIYVCIITHMTARIKNKETHTNLHMYAHTHLRRKTKRKRVQNRRENRGFEIWCDCWPEVCEDHYIRGSLPGSHDIGMYAVAHTHVYTYIYDMLM